MSAGDEQPPADAADDQVGFTEEQLLDAAKYQVWQQLALLVAQFPRAPQHAPLTKERLEELVDNLLTEQQQIAQQIMPSLEPGPAAEYPTIIVEFYRADNPNKDPAQITLVKRPEFDSTPAGVLSFGMLLAFLSEPAVRGLLKIHGYRYNFKQVRKQSPIIKA